jgi:PAS domain S-box-containing protein
MRTAIDLMTPNPKMIASGENLHDVVRLFLTLGISTSPVINPMGEILGVLTELALVKAFMLHKAKFHSHDKIGHHIELLAPASYIRTNSSLGEIIKEIINSPTNRLLVKDDRKKIVGIISPKDLMRPMLGETNPSENFKERLHDTEVKLKKSLQELSNIEKNLEVYQRVFQESPYMMHATDAEGLIIMANKREHEVLGYEHNELVGKNILNIYAPAMQQQALQELKKTRLENAPTVLYTTLLNKSGSEIRCDVSTSSIFDASGKFISSISALRPLDTQELIKNLTGIVNDNEGPLATYVQNK